ncbi:hypothetical protein PAP_10035 [Palaeococcus pacificus DY20341]|uniref:DUF1648 domain-containing protein n=1 Tax=Palaeococcus pacificus DY20341 TaxID=1343739 RepID=A0A075LW00_9EURY|nr:SdpI family protein [Palaeococcus pacificus]AIF70381.1 hypothetical protein PAP_10035 [Palaeococcus pacificus DY20341]
MEGIEIINIMFNIFIALLMLTAGLLTYLFRDKPNYAIGVRIGYTFASKEAWRKTNTFAGKAFMALGALMLILSPFVDMMQNTIIMLAGIIVIFYKGYKIAKETYELEEFKIEAPEIIPQNIPELNVRPYLFGEFAILSIYFLFLALSYDKMPQNIASHFDFYGNPNGFMEKSITSLVAFPLVISALIIGITYLSKKPLFVQFTPKFNPKAGKIFVELMFFTELLIISAWAYIIAYNAYNIHSGAIISGISFGAIIIILVEMFRLLLAIGES